MKAAGLSIEEIFQKLGKEGGLLGMSGVSPDMRDVETAARLVTSRNVADLVRAKLSLPEDADAVAAKVDAAPVAQSNIVAVTAQADSPELARDLANGFADGVVAERSEELRAQLDPLIERTRERIQEGEVSAAALLVGAKLATALILAAARS